ncbi:hypothetical protein IAR50_007233 [Cryptococcus sp. DSM 104548]
MAGDGSNTASYIVNNLRKLSVSSDEREDIVSGWDNKAHDTKLISSDCRVFYVPSYMLTTQSIVFREMFSSDLMLLALSRTDVSSDGSQNGDQQPSHHLLLELTDKELENAQVLTNVLTLLDSLECTLTDFISTHESKTPDVLWSILIFASKWDMPFLRFRMSDWTCQLAVDSYTESPTTSLANTTCSIWLRLPSCHMRRRW